jgi:fatty-acyl-CoA synthase
MATEVIGKTIPQVFEETAMRYSDRPALICDHDRRRFTYSELKSLVDRVAGGLYRLGVRRGDRVCIWLPNFAEWIVTELAALKLGAIVVPINARFRQSEVNYLLQVAEPVLIVMTDRFLTNEYAVIMQQLIPELATPNRGPLQLDNYPALRHVISVGPGLPGALSYTELESLGSDRSVAEAVTAATNAGKATDSAFIFFTSGTTSAPKGVLHNHTLAENVRNWGRLCSYSENDRVLVNQPLFYIAGTLWGFLISIIHGAAIVPCQHFTPDEVMGIIHRHRTTTMMGTPNLWRGLLNHPEGDRYDLTSLRLGSIGGAPPSRRLIEQMRSVGLAPVQVYGLTETHGFTTSTHPNDPIDVVAETIGRPLPGFELKLVNPETLAEVAQGETGEALVRGRLLMTYYRMPEEVQQPFFTAEGWYRTGDLLRQDEAGNYAFAGRTKDMIKVGGENLSSLEIENVIGQHPAVLEAAAVGVPDTARGEVVAAFVQLRTGKAATEAELIRWCKDRCAPFKVPRHVRFVATTEDWPLTPSNKIRKHILRENLGEELQAEEGHA